MWLSIPFSLSQSPLALALAYVSHRRQLILSAISFRLQTVLPIIGPATAGGQSRLDGLAGCWRRDSGPLWRSPCLPGLRCGMYLYNIDVPVRSSLHYLVEGNERTSKYDVSRRSDLHRRVPQVAMYIWRVCCCWFCCRSSYRHPRLVTAACMIFPSNTCS